MYANVRLPLTLVSNKPIMSLHFSPRYFNGIKIVTVFKCIFEETVPNCREILEIIAHKNSIRTNIPVPSVTSVLLNQNTVTMLIKFAAERRKILKQNLKIN